MHDLAKHLRVLRLFRNIPLKQLIHLLERSAVVSAKAGDIILNEADSGSLHLVLLEGDAEAERHWVAPDGFNQVATWTLDPVETRKGFGFLVSTPRVCVRALSDVRYLTLDGDVVDELTIWNQQFSEEMQRDPELMRRMNLVRQIGIFRNLQLDHVSEAFKRMYQREVQAGEIIVTQGEKGDHYYLLDSGEAEAIQTDPFTGVTSRVNQLGPGDSFGEEALLQDGCRNATVKMLTPGRLLVLDKADFDVLIRPAYVEEISSEQALEMIGNNQASLIDCRYDMEHEESRIPRSTLLPLDTLRAHVHTLDPNVTYIVYCRSGRRSKAAAFLLRERNLKAFSLTGGIKAWPYELDTSPI